MSEPVKEPLSPEAAEALLRQHCEIKIKEYREAHAAYEECSRRGLGTIKQLCRELMKATLREPRKAIERGGEPMEEIERRRDELVARNKESLQAGVSEDVPPQKTVVPDKDLNPVCDGTYAYLCLKANEVPEGEGWEPDASSWPFPNRKLSYWKRKIARGQQHERRGETMHEDVSGEVVPARREGLGTQGSADGTDHGGG